MAERVVQPLDFVFQKCCGCQCLLLGISCYGQSFFTGTSLHIPEPVIGAAVPGAIVGLGVKPGDASWALPQFLPQQCGNPPMPEVFFDRPGSPGRYTPLSPYHRASSPVTFTAGTHHGRFLQSPLWLIQD